MFTHFKDSKGVPYSLETALLAEGLAALTSQGVTGLVEVPQDVIVALGEPTPEDKARIALLTLEAQVTPRRIREAVLTANGKRWLTDKEAEISEARAALVAILNPITP